jgi:hypothetical protein
MMMILMKDAKESHNNPSIMWVSLQLELITIMLSRGVITSAENERI